MALHGFCEVVTGFSGESLSDLVPLLTEALPTLQQSSHEAIMEALGALNPETHALGWLYALHSVLCSAVPSNVPIPVELSSKVFPFLCACTAEAAQTAPLMFVEVARKAKEMAIGSLNFPKRAIIPLRSAVVALRPTPEELTPLHADFFQVCIQAKCYHAAQPILDQPILDVAVKATGTTCKDFMLYAYHGGVLRIGRKEYREAADMLALAFTMPANAVSAIAVAAYKKHALVCLLLDSPKGLAQPKGIPTIVNRYVKEKCTQYQELAQAYGRRSVEELQDYANMHRATFADDGNIGLVGLCIEALRQRNIGRLTHTHLTLSLPGIAEACKIPAGCDLEAQILQMVDRGLIFASINQRDGMVAFNEDPEEYKSSRTVDFWNCRIEASMALDAKLRAAHDEVRSSRAYLARFSSKGRISSGASVLGGDFEEDMDRHQVAPFAPSYL